MSPLPRRPRLAPLVLTAAAALALAGCVPLPPDVPPVITDPSPSVPQPSEPAPAPTEPTESTEPGTDPDAGALPELLEVGDVLEPGTLPGWETSITTDSAFAPQPDSDFPLGPTIHVVESATDCTFWAYQGQQDIDSTDEVESSEATLAALTDSSPDDWDADTFQLAPSASQGVAVVLLSLFEELEDGSTEAWFARNFQSSQTTSAIRAACGPDTGGIEHIDEVVLEHFQINFLVP